MDEVTLSALDAGDDGWPVHVGTSGWHYAHWRGLFYPEALPDAAMLAFYARHFDCVELNNSFYRLPTADAFALWRNTVPPGFRFAVKGSRYITHVRKLREPEEPIRRLTEAAGALGVKLGPVLFQLPPHWRCDIARLRAFLQAWPRSWPSAWEFRDITWLRDDVYQLLAEHGAALCISDMKGAQTPVLVTAAHVYVRLHGALGAYAGQYSDETLEEWAKLFVAWARSGHRVWCFFNNDLQAHAIGDAKRLRLLATDESAHGVAARNT